MLRGARGERSAERVLEAHGYRVCARQVRTRYRMDVDRASHEVELVLDLVVERDGERLVAEVKTGRFAPRHARADTRRQLLEYQLATGSPRVLLVDPEAESVTELALPIGSRPARAPASWPLLVATALAIAALSWHRGCRVLQIPPGFSHSR